MLKTLPTLALPLVACSADAVTDAGGPALLARRRKTA